MKGPAALVGLLLLVSGPARAQPGGQLCGEAGQSGDCLDVKKSFSQGAVRPGTPPSSADPGNPCPKDWRSAKKGGCWIESAAFSGTKERAYVHPKGWVVDARCLKDGRFTPEQLLAGLDSAWRKMSPSVGVAQGGCLSRFNPWWGKELVAAVWENQMHLGCPGFDPKASSCADREERSGLNLLSFRNVSRCVGPGTTGLAGVIFHESLHAAGADNFSTEKHNRAWDLEQYVFVRDRVYAAEAVCFYGTDPGRRALANILQCRAVADYHAEEPRQHLCEGFSASFTDMPAGFIKH